jgi:hypothetical protein
MVDSDLKLNERQLEALDMVIAELQSLVRSHRETQRPPSYADLYPDLD